MTGLKKILFSKKIITIVPTVQFIVNEDFESGSLPTNWFRGGSADFGYTGTVLAGTKSLSCDSATSDYAVWLGNTPTFSQIWIKFIFRPVTLPASFGQISYLTDVTQGHTVFAVDIFANGTLTILDELGFATGLTVAAMSAGTTYFVWIRYKKGTGANAEGELWFNTVDDRAGTPANNHCQYSVGGATLDGDLLLFNSISTHAIYDNVQMSATDFS